MILLTCSVSFLSSAAIIAEIVRTASPLMMLVLASACCASVCTACSTAVLASSVLGLNSFLSSAAKSLPSSVMPASAEPCLSCSAIRVAPVRGDLCEDRSLLRLGFGCQRAEQRRIGQDLGDELLGSSLAVHVGDEIRQLRARL